MKCLPLAANLPRVLAIAAILVASAAPDLAAQTADSGSDARVHPAQARRGVALFQQHCHACHTTTQFQSAAFAEARAGRPVFELFDEIRTSMPQNAPGQLSAQEYLDIVVYLLELNGHATAEEELPVDEAVLQRVRFRGKRPSL